MLTRATTSLAPEVEAAGAEVIDAALAVHRALGPGFLERIYKDALCVELAARHVAFEREKTISVRYRNIAIRGQRVDLIVAELVIVELKAVVKTDPIHDAKVISYLKTTGLRLGFLINFHSRLLKDGIRRIVV